MSTEQVKKAFQEAQKDLDNDKSALLKTRIKDVIKTTLEKIEEEESHILIGIGIDDGGFFRAISPLIDSVVIYNTDKKDQNIGDN